MAGLSDIHHDLCLGLALWNGADPILKERMFGLTGPQGNHGEDVKDYWWYLDALPSHAWLRWRYHYPQAAFPYQRLVEENARRSRDEPEFELLDTGVFDDNRYWSVDVAYAKASPTEVLARITIENHGPEEATLSVLPTLWFRNTWRVVREPSRRRCSWMATASRSSTRGCPGTGWTPRPTADGMPAGGAVLRQRDQHRPAVRVGRRSPPIPKDGINDHVVSGAPTVNPEQRRHQGGLVVPADRAGRGHGRAAAAAAPAGPRRTARRSNGARGTGPAPLRRRRWPPGSGRPTSSTPRSRRPAPTRNGCGCCGRPAPGWSGASRCTRTG